MSRGQFILSADVADLIRGFVNVQQAQAKTETGFKKTAEAGRQSFRSLEQEMKRLERAPQQAAVQTVANVRARTSGAALALSAAQRATLSGSAPALGYTDMGQLQAIALQRRFRAQALREERAADARHIRAAGSGGGMSWLVASAGRSLAAADQRYDARIGAEGMSLANQAAIGYFAGGGLNAGDDKVMAAARRRVARNVAGVSELAGKVSPEEFETMSGQMAQRMNASRALIGKFVVGAAVVGAGVLAGVQKLVSDIEQAQKDLASYHGGARGLQTLPVYQGLNSTQIKAQALGLSNEYGLGVNDVVTPLMNQVAVQGQDLTNAEREEVTRLSLRRQQMGSGSASATAGIIDNITDVYKNMTPTQAAGVSDFLRAEGGMTVEEQASFLPMLLPTAQMMGTPIEDIAAIAAMTTETGGADMGRSARSMMQGFGKLRSKGVLTGKGGIYGDFGELAAMDDASLEQAVGMEAANARPILDLIVKNRSLYDAKRAAVDRYTSSDTIEGKHATIQSTDPEGAMALKLQQEMTKEANAPLAANQQAQQYALRVQEFQTRRAQQRTQAMGENPVWAIGERAFDVMTGFEWWGPYVAPLLGGEVPPSSVGPPGATGNNGALAQAMAKIESAAREARLTFNRPTTQPAPPNPGGLGGPQ